MYQNPYEYINLIGINTTEFSEFKPVNLEFGLNILPNQDVREIINGVAYYKKTKFKYSRTSGGELRYSKILDATSEKQIKIYAKGIHCHEVLNAPEIDANTFRYEIKSKKSRYLRKLGINTLTDLLNSKTYTRLGQELINDFHQILILNLNLNLDALKTEERKYIKRTNKVEFWDNLRVEINRNKFGRYRAKYIKIMHSKKIKHSENLGQKIEEKTAFLSDVNSPKKTAINKGIFENSPIASDVIKGENAPLTQTLIIKHLQNIVSFSLDSINKKSHRYNTIKEEIKAYKNIKNIDEVINLKNIDKRICEVTGLDISMQKANSRYLCFSGLKYYQANAPELFKDLECRYLTTKAKDKDLDARIYYMAHNIRNTKTNKKHNRKRFEARNYPPEQLSLF